MELVVMAAGVPASDGDGRGVEVGWFVFQHGAGVLGCGPPAVVHRPDVADAGARAFVIAVVVSSVLR